MFGNMLTYGVNITQFGVKNSLIHIEPSEDMRPQYRMWKISYKSIYCWPFILANMQGVGASAIMNLSKMQQGQRIYHDEIA